MPTELSCARSKPGVKVSSALAGAAPITIPRGAKGDRAASALFQVGNGFEDTGPDTPSRDGGEKAFDRVQDALHTKFLLF